MMKLRNTMIVAVIALCRLSILAADPLKAADWSEKEKEKLNGINAKTLVAIAKGAPDSYQKLFAEVKPDYKSDPVELTRIAALTQIIATAAKPETRSAYADALLAAASEASAADVACFFLDQLRWCATPQQTVGIQKLTKSEKKGVAALAAITALASEGNIASQQKDAQANVYAEYSTQIARVSGPQKLKALISGFENADPKIAGIAMREASQIDIQEKISTMSTRQAASAMKRLHASGKQETKIWCEKLAATDDPVRVTMLIDMLGTRGNPEALEALSGFLGYADNTVALAAHRAMLKIDKQTYAKALPAVLRSLSDSQSDLFEKLIMGLPTKLLEQHLIDDFNSYSMNGKKIMFAILGKRRSEKGVALALEAIKSTATDQVAQGYRLLRDCAGPAQAEILINRLVREKHTRARHVQEAVAGATRRDTTGTYLKLLDDAWNKAKPEKRISLLGAFSRIGEKKFLDYTEEALRSEDTEMSSEAIRALSTWNSLDVLPILMKVAYTSDDNKHRVLAQRGIVKMLGVKGVDKAKWKEEWNKISSGEGNAQIKKTIDSFFAK
jgi:hypothetical protein